MRFEARVLVSGVELLKGVQSDLIAGGSILLKNVPVVRLLFHFVFLGFDPLRFEANFGFALFGAEFEEVVERFVESAGVGGLIAQVEGEHFGVFDLASFGVEAGIDEGLGASSEPVRFAHGVDENGFGFGGGLVFGDEGGF